MGKRKRYSAELQQELVRLVQQGRSPESVAREFEPTAQAIRRWVRQAELEAGKRTDGLKPTGRTRCGSPTSRMCRRGWGSSIWLSCSTYGVERSSVGRWHRI